MKPVATRLKKEIADIIEREAKDADVTVSELVRYVLTIWAVSVNALTEEER